MVQFDPMPQGPLNIKWDEPVVSKQHLTITTWKGKSESVRGLKIELTKDECLTGYEQIHIRITKNRNKYDFAYRNWGESVDLFAIYAAIESAFAAKLASKPYKLKLDKIPDGPLSIDNWKESADVWWGIHNEANFIGEIKGHSLNIPVCIKCRFCVSDYLPGWLSLHIYMEELCSKIYTYLLVNNNKSSIYSAIADFEVFAHNYLQFLETLKSTQNGKAI